MAGNTAKKTGTKKTNGSKSTRTSSTRSNKPVKQRLTKEQYALRQEIKAIIIIALSILLFICNFGLIGKFGDALSGVMFGLFGVLAYVFPIILGLCTIYLLVNASVPRAVRKTVALWVLFIAIGMLIDVIAGGLSVTASKYDIVAFYKNGVEFKRGGGLISSSIAYLLFKLIAKVGTIIFATVLVIVSAIIITEKSLFEGVVNTKDRLLEHGGLNSDYRQELQAERLEKLHLRQQDKALRAAEKRQLAEERRARIEEQNRLLEEEARNKEALNKEALSKEGSSVLTPPDKKTVSEDAAVLKRNTKIQGITNDNVIREPEDVLKRNDEMHEINLNGFDPVTRGYAGFDDQEAVVIDDHDNDMEEIYVSEEPEEKTAPEPVPSPAPVINQRPKAVKRPDPIPETLDFNTKSGDGYVFPPMDLLKRGGANRNKNSEVISDTADKLKHTLASFGIEVTIDPQNVCVGPTVTRYELGISGGTKVSRIKNLSDDIKLSLAATDIRIEAPIPGKSAVGIEVPNRESTPVLFRDLIDNNEFKNAVSGLSFAIGKDISGKNMIYDIDKFPHLLIAGATGSGKSVCINTLIMSILYKSDPDDVKLIMIDPKVVELSVYNGIPHLLLPVVTDPKKASATLNFAVAEMMERYKKFADMNTRDLDGYNRAVAEIKDDPTPEMHKKLPRIVIIVDELADLVMVAKNEVEDAICRIAQLARAAGIHLIIATQRPSVDVITGLIKANMPSRIAFAVSSGIDSRTILDMTGAEELLGKGDMLFFPKGLKKPVRLQGGFVSDEEVNRVVDFLKSHCSADYNPDISAKIESMSQSTGKSSGGSGSSDEDGDGFDDKFIEAGRFVVETQKASIGNLQRKFKMGFNRAARIMDQLYDAGVVGEDLGTKPREVLMSPEQFENYIENEL